MFKISEISSVFDTIAHRINHLSFFSTPIGSQRFNSACIVIRSVGSCKYVVCFCGFNSNFGVSGYCLARSYPMSYKAAHQLVCSL